MLIWGTQTQAFIVALTRFVCGLCHREAPQRIYERRTRFTFFFLPLFTTNRVWFLECVQCGRTTWVNKDYALGAIEWEAKKADRARIVGEYEALQRGE